MGSSRMKVSFSIVAVISSIIILVQSEFLAMAKNPTLNKSITQVRLVIMLYRGLWSSRLKPQSISTTIRGIAFTLLGLITLMSVADVTHSRTPDTYSAIL